MALAKIGPWPKVAINDFSSFRASRTQPALWQPIGTADLPTTTDTANRAAVITGDLAYDTTAADLVVFDGSNWVAVGATFGAFSSVTAGSGMDLSAQTAGFRAYSDDGGSGTVTGNRRGSLSRLLLTIDNAVGVSYRASMSQLKLVAGVDFTSVNSVLAGVQGYLELAGTHTFGGQVAAGEFTVEGADNITVSSGAVLAGVASRLNMASGKTITETGECAAFYADVTGGAGDKWPKGFYCAADAADIGFEAGIHSNSVGDGIDLDAVTAANRFHADDGGTAGNTGNRRNVLARTLISITATAGVSYRSIVGQMKVAAGVGMSHANSVLAGAMGYIELAGASTFAGFVSAGEFTVEPGGVLTVSSGGVVCGVSALLNFTGAHSWTETGFGAAFYAGVTGDNEAATRRWPVALHINGCDAVIRAETASSYEDGMKIADGVAGDTGSEGKVGFDALMKCFIGGTEYYIALFDADSVTGE